MKKKRYITLIEIMIVMFLIAMITGVVAYNYRGSLDKGKKFQTEMAMEKLDTILQLYLAEHPGEKQNLETDWREWVRHSDLVKTRDFSKITKDGWGDDFEVSLGDDNETIVIYSARYSNE